MSTFASITWGIVAGFTILQVIELLTDYAEAYIRGRRLRNILENLDDALSDLEYEFEQAKPARKKAAVKKATKRK
jgi:hypothetical protein